MKIVILLLLSSVTLSAQFIGYSAYPPEMSIESYHRSGFTTLGFSSAADIADANPASIALFDNIAAGLSFEYNSTINISNIVEVRQSRSKPLLPASFGLVYPANNFTVAIGYIQKYNSYQRFPLIPITTFENPEGSGEFVRPIFDRTVHSPSLMGSYTFGDNRNGNNRLSLGAQMIYNYAVFTDKVINTKLLFREGNFNWKVGLQYNYKDDIAIGIFYESKWEIDGTAEYDPDPNLLRFDSGNEDGGNNYRIEVNELKMKLKLPGKIAVGLSAKTLNNLRLSFAFSTIGWSEVYDAYRSQVNLSSAAVYSLSETAKISVGFFNSVFHYKNDRNYYTSYRVNWNRSFITAGAEVNFDNFALQLELMDNHLLAVEKFYQTLAKVGLNYTFE